MCIIVVQKKNICSNEFNTRKGQKVITQQQQQTNYEDFYSFFFLFWLGIFFSFSELLITS